MPETLTYQNAACEATVTVAQPAADTLHITYRLLNRGSEPLYLCNQLLQSPANDHSPAPVSTQTAQVQVDEAGVLVAQAIVDVSFREGVRALDIPYLTPLLPGQPYAQTIVLALPLLPTKVRGARPGQSPAVPLPLRLTLGYFVGSPTLAPHLRAVATSLGTAYQIEDFLSNMQQLLTVGPFQAPVSVANAVADGRPSSVGPEEWTPWG